MKLKPAILLLSVAFLSPACSRRPAGTPTPRPPSVLDLADEDFRSGGYGEAARLYQRHLDENPGAADRDRALFRAGLSHALSGQDSWVAARPLLERLTAEHPNSPYAAEAGFILRLRAELDAASAALADRDAVVKKLTGELERLKKIDSERPRFKPPR